MFRLLAGHYVPDFVYLGSLLMRDMRTRLTEEEVALLVVEAEDRQHLAAGSELAVGHVVPRVDQFDHTPPPASCQDAAGLSRRRLVSSGHQHGGPGQGEELLRGQRGSGH